MTDKLKTVPFEGTTRRIDENTKIVRYMKLETLLLLLAKGWIFIPSHANLGRSDRLETGILFNLPDRWKFWKKWSPKIGERLDKFECARLNREHEKMRASKMRGSLSVGGSYAASDIRPNLRKYVDELAAERCVWCWNEFRNYSNALWHLYGNRGVAITSTVEKVKAALVNAGVARGIVAPITYINHEGRQVPEVLMKEENIFRPYLLKSIAYDYEKEIRFVLAAEREILRENGGVLISINAATFIEGFRVSPHLQREEHSIAKSIVDELLKKARATNKTSSLEPDWSKRYKQNNGTPFTTEDSLPSDVFSDLS
jgi:hypothetical protein